MCHFQLAYDLWVMFMKSRASYFARNPVSAVKRDVLVVDQERDYAV